MPSLRWNSPGRRKSKQSWKGSGWQVSSTALSYDGIYQVVIVRIERDRLNRTKELKKRLEEAKHQLEVAQRQGEYEKASQLRFATIPDLERQLPSESETKNRELEDEGKLGGMLHDRVTSDDIARVVAKATGIPVTNLLKGERDKLVHVSEGV